MKIVFWSCFPGHARVTSNLVACALSAAVDHSYTVGLLQTQYRNNNMQGCFIDDSALNSINNEYYQDSGIDSLMRNVTAGATTREQIVSCSYSFLKQKLNLYVGTSSNDSNVYFRSLAKVLQRLLIDVNEAYDLTFIDTLAGANQISRDAIAEADTVVVCLPQIKWVLDYFFSTYKIEANNIFYVFGDYDPKKKLNIKTLQKLYKKKFTKNNCGFILHNPEYADAIDAHKAINFYLAHRNARKKDANIEFMQSVRNCTTRMLKHAGVKVYTEDRAD